MLNADLLEIGANRFAFVARGDDYLTDIMRYAIANQGLDVLAHYGDFQP